MIDTYEDNMSYPKNGVTNKSSYRLNVELSLYMDDRGNTNDQFRLKIFLEDG